MTTVLLFGSSPLATLQHRYEERLMFDTSARPDGWSHSRLMAAWTAAARPLETVLYRYCFVYRRHLMLRRMQEET
jgi:hypothetical protein